MLTEFRDVIAASEEVTGKFTGEYNCPHARVEVVSDAPIRYISVKPTDALFGCRRDVLNGIKELHPATIRVPGGYFAEKYPWKECES